MLMLLQWRKVILISVVYYLAIILQGCCTDCQPPDLPFFDYKSLEFQTHGPFPSRPDRPFSIIIRPNDIEYVASVAPSNKYQWGIINAAYACECEYDGDWGPKYAIKEVNIYSDSIFYASIPEGQPLNRLFETAPTDLSGRNNYLPLESVNNDDGLFPRIHHITDEIYLRTYAQPVSFGRPYYFTIEIVRENGTVIRGTTEPIVWSE